MAQTTRMEMTKITVLARPDGRGLVQSCALRLMAQRNVILLTPPGAI